MVNFESLPSNNFVETYKISFRAQSNISAVAKQQGTILFSENCLIYPKTV
jgi:hypothetical protein